MRPPTVVDLRPCHLARLLLAASIPPTGARELPYPLDGDTDQRRVAPARRPHLTLRQATLPRCAHRTDPHLAARLPPAQLAAGARRLVGLAALAAGHPDRGFTRAQAAGRGL